MKDNKNMTIWYCEETKDWTDEPDKHAQKTANKKKKRITLTYQKKKREFIDEVYGTAMLKRADFTSQPEEKETFDLIMIDVTPDKRVELDELTGE